MAKIVLISGKGEAGKTTTAEIMRRILEERGMRVLITPFAKYLKFLCTEYFKWDGKKDENGRHILQYIGTDVVRKRSPNFWVNAVVDFIKVFSEDFDYFIIDDCRFPGEIKCFSDLDYLTIRVERPYHKTHLTPEQERHPSETSLDNWKFDFYMYNTAPNLEELEYDVRGTMDRIGWFALGEKHETSSN